MIWYIWWLSIISLIGIIACVIIRLSGKDEHELIPAQKIKELEALHLNRKGAL